MPNDTPATPRFEQVFTEDIDDGYWIGAVDLNGDGRPDLVASGLAKGHLVWYENPTWERRLIATLSEPVAWHYADITGDRRTDVVICHDFGGCPRNCKPEDGKISWIRNPGPSGFDEPWPVHPVDDLMATHRLKIGHFTGTDDLEIVAVPLVGPGNPLAPCPITLYRAPTDDLQGASGWDATVVDDSHFHVIHEALSGRFDPDSDLESLLLCSNEGITWLRYQEDQGWQRHSVAEGQEEMVAGLFKGTGNVALCRVGDDPHAFMVALEPFHGNSVVAYTREGSGSLTSPPWTRAVLDVYGSPNEKGEGTGHHIVAGDFDGDGDDEFLVGLRGPPPNQGVFYYKPIDPENGVFERTQVSDLSTSMIAVADFNGDGRLDFATIGYHTPGFFMADEPRIAVFENRFGQVPSSSSVSQGKA